MITAGYGRIASCDSRQTCPGAARGVRWATFWQTEGGPKQTVEWQRGSLVSPPLNCFYQHYNLDGSKPARLYAATTAPTAINFLRDTEFVFNTPYVFNSRYAGEENFFSDPGEHLARTEWRTNFIADLRTFELDPYPERGGGGVNMHFEIANNASRAHISQFQPGTYKKGHRHAAGAHVIVLDGVGYSLLWKEGEEKEKQKIDWKDGAVVSPGHGEFHQHFNTGPEPAKYVRQCRRRARGCRAPDRVRRRGSRDSVAVRTGVREARRRGQDEADGAGVGEYPSP